MGKLTPQAPFSGMVMKANHQVKHHNQEVTKKANEQGRLETPQELPHLIAQI